MKDSYAKPCTKLAELVEKFSTVFYELLQIGVKRFLGQAESRHE
jgi:hypothetical protein